MVAEECTTGACRANTQVANSLVASIKEGSFLAQGSSGHCPSTTGGRFFVAAGGG